MQKLWLKDAAEAMEERTAKRSEEMAKRLEERSERMEVKKRGNAEIRRESSSSKTFRVWK